MKEDVIPRRVAGIEGDAELVGIEIEEEAAFLWMGQVLGEGASHAGLVAGRRMLDLDDLRSHVAQELGAVRPGNERSVLDDLEVLEGACVHGRSGTGRPGGRDRASVYQRDSRAGSRAPAPRDNR